MSRRDLRAERDGYPPLPPSKCAKFLYYTWKLCSVVFSHLVMISLVVAYCILGAVTFEKLEAQYEREVKQNISVIRGNTTQSIWRMTQQAPFLQQDNWTSDVVDMLKDFENSILLEMKVRGWDGHESTEHIQWTFTGSLFYSIVVITTIGYGHITPKTQSGKVVTIFYAILGIPLMLLCLSNIGDVMASSFRFLYWRVCCYVCTRPPKRRHHHSRHPSFRHSVRGSNSRNSRKRQLERSHSDTDFGRVHTRDPNKFSRSVRDSGYGSGRPIRPRAPQQRATMPRTRSQPPHRFDLENETDIETRPPRRFDKQTPRDYCRDSDYDEFPKISLPLHDLDAALQDLNEHQSYSKESRSKSLPRPLKPKFDGKYYSDDFEYDKHENITNQSKRNRDLKTFDTEEGFEDGEIYEMHDLDLEDVDLENYKERKALEERRRKRREYDNTTYRNDRREDRRSDRGYGSLRDKGYDPEDDDYDFDYPYRRRPQYDRRFNRGRSEYCEREQAYPEKRRERDKRARSAVYNYESRFREEDERDLPNKADTGRGRKKLRRLQTFDDSRLSPPYKKHSPSPDQENWSDEALPRRIRPGMIPRYPEIYPAVQDVAVLKEEIKPVPIWLCVFLVASYIVAGTFLFKRWEGWAYLDAAYFCFITLTTIGFGDFVPAQGQSGDPAAAVHSIALCSLYLLFGIALLAMSFNLVQEEVRANVAHIATKLGIIKPKGEEYDDDDY